MNQRLWLILTLRAVNAIEVFILLGSLNFFLIQSGYSLVLSAEFFAAFLGLNYVLPVISSYLANKALPLNAFYIISNWLLLFIYAIIFFTGTHLSGVTLALLAAPLSIQGIATTQLINIETKGDDFLRRRAMIWSYGLANLSSLTCLFLSYIFFKFNLQSFIFLLLIPTPLLSNFIYLKVMPKDGKPILSARNWIVMLGISTIAFIVFDILFEYLELFHLLFFMMILLSFGYFIIRSIKMNFDKKTIKISLYMMYYFLSVGFFSIMFLNYTMMLDFAKQITYLPHPQFFLTAEPIAVLFFFMLVSRLVQSFRKSKIAPFVTPLLFSFSFTILILAILGISFFQHFGLNPIIVLLVYMVMLALGECFISGEGFTLAGRLLPVNMQLFGVGLWNTFIGVSYLSTGYINETLLKNQNIILGIQQGLTKIALLFMIFVPVILICCVVAENKLRVSQ